MLLVMVGVGSLVFGLVASWSLIIPAMAFAIIVLALIYTIGPISGCHINPAVSIGVWSIGGMKTKDMVIYVIMQIIGGIIGAAVLYFVFMDANTAVTATNFGTVHYSDPKVAGAYGIASVFIIEIFVAFILQIVILGSLGNKGNEALAGVAIGLTVGGLILFTGAIDGAGINPIRSLSPALFVNSTVLTQAIVISIANIIGAVVGSFLFKWLATPMKKAA
jgi:aquaporin Z